jgi:hypothetical protein
MADVERPLLLYFLYLGQPSSPSMSFLHCIMLSPLVGALLSFALEGIIGAGAVAISAAQRTGSGVLRARTGSDNTVVLTNVFDNIYTIPLLAFPTQNSITFRLISSVAQSEIHLLKFFLIREGQIPWFSKDDIR